MASYSKAFSSFELLICLDSESFLVHLMSLTLYSNKFINYDQKIVCTSMFRLPS